LAKSLKEISDNLNRLNSYAQFNNRKRISSRYQTDKPTNKNEISDEFSIYFYDLIDDDWSLSINNDADFYTRIEIRKCIKKEGLELEFNTILDTMSEIRDRLVDEGFKSKFIIFFNDRSQQVTNPEDYSLPIYKFTGIGGGNFHYVIGDHLSSIGGSYKTSDFIFAKIEFIII